LWEGCAQHRFLRNFPESASAIGWRSITGEAGCMGGTATTRGKAARRGAAMEGHGSTPVSSQRNALDDSGDSKACAAILGEIAQAERA
jgi:hypothetical protein